MAGKHRPARPGARQAAPPPEPVSVRISSVGADGDGIATHTNGARLYIPFTVPGDLVHARPEQRRGEAWAATPEAVEKPGPNRQEPACAHFGVCGGCVAQHWADPGYLDWKIARLTEALRRAGYEDPPIAPIVRGHLGTRRRMDLAVRRIQGGMTVGLHRARGEDIVDISECPVLHPTLFHSIAPARAMLSGIGAIRRQASLVVNLLDSGPDMLLRTDGELTLSDRTKLIAFAGSHSLPRLSWALDDGPVEAICLLRPPTTSFSGAIVIPPAGAFLQATAEGEAAIVAAVLEGLPTKRVNRSRVLELYAGCGTIGFALAELIKVTAIEGDEALVSAYHTAINQAGLMGKVEVKRRDLVRQPFLAKELSAYSAILLDPPHGGAAAQMPYIAESKVPAVIYVSCDPVSLGRDAAILRAGGYRLEKVTPIDQFLWSARLEAVAVFRWERSG